jgi:hypothetical protein
LSENLFERGTRADVFFHPLSLTAKKVENNIFATKENGRINFGKRKVENVTLLSKKIEE